MFGQVGIGTTTPDASAQLDIVGTDKGLLIPRVSLSNVGNITIDGVHTAATGLLIYNTNATTVGGGGEGYYYFNGTIWERLITTASSGATTASNGLNETGNNIMLGGALTQNTTITQGNFGMTYNLDGTADFKVASNTNPNMFSVDANTNRVGIGTANPSEVLQVNGGARINTGAVIGEHNSYGTHLLTAASSTTPSLKLGALAFNEVESGRLTFEENVPTYNTAGPVYCGFQFYLDGSTDKFHLSSACTTELRIMTVERGGDIGIATTNPTASLSVNGAANKVGGGTWTVFSDARLKTNVSNYKEGLDLIMKVKPVNFSYNERYKLLFGENKEVSQKVFQGVIAQDIQKIAPDMVTNANANNSNDNDDADGGTSKDGTEEYLQVDPNKFTYALINAVQQQQKQIEIQDKEIDELKTMLKQLLATKK